MASRRKPPRHCPRRLKTMDRARSNAVTDLRSFEGTTLQDSYELVACVGEGNFGAVFRSRQRFLGVPVRRVAVKLSKHVEMTGETARDVFADAFLLAEAMDGMTDPEARRHLVHVYDMGIALQEGRRGFLVMEYVEGTTLQAQFESYERVPSSLLMKWGRQICQGLAGLHSLSPPVLHRDLKPDNVLLGSDRSVRIVDFGLAARLLAQGLVPGVAGTLAYMSPETTRGESVPASDVYSVGMMLYEGLTGKRPYEHLVAPRDLPAAAYRDWLHDAKRKCRVTPPSELNNTVDPRLDRIVLGCLAFQPGERPASAAELLDVLDGGAAGAEDQTPSLEAGRRQAGSGNLDGARRVLEEGLRTPRLAREARFQLLRELGAVLVRLEDHAGASKRLTEAWDLARDGALLRTRAERAALLGELAGTFRMADNAYQARRYEALRLRELGRGAVS